MNEFPGSRYLAFASSVGFCGAHKVACADQSNSRQIIERGVAAHLIVNALLYRLERLELVRRPSPRPFFYPSPLLLHDRQSRDQERDGEDGGECFQRGGEKAVTEEEEEEGLPKTA